MKKILIIALIILVIIGAALFGYSMYVKSKTPKIIVSFEDCVNAGELVVDTNPRECHTKKGEVYIEEDNHLILADYVEVTEPKPYTVLASPFKIEGKALGTWYGNNRLTIQLVDQNGRLLVAKSVFAKTDITTPTVKMPFVAAIDFHAPNVDRGKILIEKVSAIDIPGKNGPLIIPVRFR